MFQYPGVPDFVARASRCSISYFILSGQTVPWGLFTMICTKIRAFVYFTFFRVHWQHVALANNCKITQFEDTYLYEEVFSNNLAWIPHNSDYHEGHEQCVELLIMRSHWVFLSTQNIKSALPAQIWVIIQAALKRFLQAWEDSPTTYCPKQPKLKVKMNPVK